MKIYNTLSRQKEEFKPLEGNEVRIYSCGPTVYNYAHIGNLRTYIFMDTLRRVLRLNGYKLKHVMNITDVGHLVSDADEGEDKMAKAAKAQQKTPEEIAEYYTNVFFDDIKSLNIETPEIVVKATEHIRSMIEFVVSLVEKGYAYETSDGIYFDIEKFPEYGKLSRINLEDQMAGARVSVNDEKRHPADFAVWKKAPKEHIMQWASPWGMGYPGWHIECSAMARDYLGDEFDIHTGGVDHIPIHHENEIAQSEALTGKETVKYWMHAEFLLVDGGKMSKSLGNTYTIQDLKERGYEPLAYRYFCLNGHYRNKLNFTFDALTAASKALDRLYDALMQHKEGQDDVSDELIKDFEKDFLDAVNDDLNIPQALGVVWKALRNSEKSRKIYDFVIKTDNVLGLDMENQVIKREEAQKNAKSKVSEEVHELIRVRAEAKKNKDYARADAIRDQLKEMGIKIIDTPEGTKIVD